MRLSRLSLFFGAIVLAVINVGAAIGRATERISEAIWSGLAYVVRTVSWSPSFAGEGFGGFVHQSIASYDQPDQTALRHEAHVKKRAAGRNI